MAPINFSEELYVIEQDVFGRPVTFNPLMSQPDGGVYLARGIYDTEEINIVLEDGSIFTDQRTILDIRDEEFSVLPIQGDTVDIDYEPVTNLPRRGLFMVTKITDNGGGEFTLDLKKIAP